MANLLNQFLWILLILNSILCVSQERSEYIYINHTNIEDHLIKDTKQMLIKDIEKKIDEFIVYYENHGHPFAQIRLENIQRDTADLIVKKGSLYTIDSIVIYGTPNISQKHISNILNIRKGDVYDQRKMNDIKERIKLTGYLNSDKEYELVFHKNTVDIYLYLIKERNNLIDGMVGFDTEEDKVHINGFTKIKLKNLINKGESIEINWHAEQKRFQRMESFINFPYLINPKINIEAHLEIYKQKDNFSNMLAETRIYYKIKNNSSFSVNYQNKTSIAEQEPFSSSQQNNIGVGVRFNDQESNEIHLNAYFGKRFPEGQQEDNYVFHLNTSNDININKISKIKISSLSSLIFSQNLYANELLFFGGSKDLRGFGEDEFFANKYSIITAGIHYEIEEIISSSIFFQQAYFEKNVVNYQKESGWPRSIGFGVGINNNARHIRIYYAIGVSKSHNFNLQNGKMHLSIENKF